MDATVAAHVLLQAAVAPSQWPWVGGKMSRVPGMQLAHLDRRAGCCYVVAGASLRAAFTLLPAFLRVLVSASALAGPGLELQSWTLGNTFGARTQKQVQPH